MATEQQTDLQQYCHETATKAKRAASELQLCSTESRNNWLRAAANALRDGHQKILQATAHDIEAAPQFNLTDAQIDVIRAWSDAGAPLGDPSDGGDELPYVGTRLSRVDHTLSMD